MHWWDSRGVIGLMGDISFSLKNIPSYLLKNSFFFIVFFCVCVWLGGKGGKNKIEKKTCPKIYLRL